MPEGDSIWRAASRLNEALAGRIITASDFRVPRFATLNLTGWTMAEVVPRGKHLLMRLTGPVDEDPGASRKPRALTIHSHLKMEGSWIVYPPRGRWTKPGHTARCVLRTADADAVGFSLGILEVVPTADEDKIVGHLGPDLLGPDWDEEEALRRLNAEPEVTVGFALLDQRKLAGIGNIYRNEACYLSGVHPTMLVGDVPDLTKIVRDAKRLLGENLGPGRRTTLGPRALRPGYWVYGRERQPCRRCGATVRRGLLAAPDGTEERDIYFCPRCQPAP
ncbi:Fpg/Nei family DNA glycosylase [Paenarthrobacter ilicis]|uniref:DNA-(apurinic or apyrimidinic site) lyase n=1 Tax=Paenarthrobacter ilicis TaxID=43665 RepID=A0ABX0TIL3_9MICC|nr:Fpg/Nei family DNA glycosylase [Paenarthrobacter ilicis]MBM7792097.1 endonuclease-8 [Paenarthrobacter ilicis]NIJ01278.1 endonuclease-8 [Paenarthrobacter ilicis]